VIQACDRQLRVGPGGVYGLDFAAVFAVAAASGLGASSLLAAALPDIERLAVRAHQNPEETDGD
jgi:hypothetical protein